MKSEIGSVNVCFYFSIKMCMIYLYCYPLYKYVPFQGVLYLMFWLHNWPASSSPEKQQLVAVTSQKHKPHCRRRRQDVFKFCCVGPQLSNYHGPTSYLHDLQQRKCLSTSQNKIFLTPKTFLAYTVAQAMTNLRLQPLPKSTWFSCLYLLQRPMAVDQTL